MSPNLVRHRFAIAAAFLVQGLLFISLTTRLRHTEVMDDDPDLAIDDEPTDGEPEVEDDDAAARGVEAQALVDRLRADTERVREFRTWLDGVVEREARLVTYLRGEWLDDRDVLFTAGASEGDLDVFDEDEPWEVIARAQAARRALNHALDED
jgi:hypothetical protein